MQVVVFKSKDALAAKFFDIESVWNNVEKLNGVTLEISVDDFSKYKAAIEHYNRTNKEGYTAYVLCFENDDMADFLADFRSYEKLSKERIAKEEAERLLRLKQEKEKREAAKALRALKSLAKEMNLSLDEVRAKFGK